MTSVKKYISAFLAALFMTGFLAATPAVAAEKDCVNTNHIDQLTEEEHFMLYES